MKWKVLPKKNNDLIKQLLINRNIETKKEKEQFFNSQLSDYKIDFKIPGISKALDRIKKAIKTKELIVAFGDYDVDGICGAAVLYLGLTKMGAKVLPYIPHREKEGYGLSRQGLDFTRDAGAALVITTDCGIVNFAEAEYAKEIGLDLVITDHHQPLDKKFPKALAIIHTTSLCGTAVTWTLFKDEELLDLVALATVSDMMPLLGVNRALVKKGLEILNHTKRVGLLALYHEADIKQGEIRSYEIGHMIAPRLNAMGRLEHAIDSLRLLCTKDPLKAKRLARLLSETNTTRQQMTTDAIEQAKLLVDARKKIHILTSYDWSPGIIGLIAGRICEQYYRPTIAISVGETTSKGSARSVNGVNIVEVIRKCSDILIDVGGHPGAAGFSILSKHLEIFKKRLEKHAIDLPEQEKVLEIDAEVQGEQLTKSLVENLQKFEPFGLGNPRPVFASYGMEVSDIRTVGEGKHLKFKVSSSVIPSGSEGSPTIDAIAFGMGELAGMLQNGQMVGLAYTIDIDNYNGMEKLQLKVKDIKV